MGNGTSLTIENTGSTLLHTPKTNFQLQNVLHYP
jgi:hypothetical protein